MIHFNKLAALGLLLAGSLTANAINVTFRVSDADAVLMDINGTVTTLQAGNNSFNLDEYTYATFSGVSPYIITGVTNSSGTPESIYGGMWYKSIYSSDEGQVYTISVKDLDETRTASCTVKVDDPSLVDATLAGTNSPVSFTEGSNTLKFDPTTETTLTLSSTNYQKPLYKVTLDGVDVPSDGGSFNVPLTQGCVIDITAKIPAVPVNVTFTYSDEGLGALSSVAVEGQTVTDFNGTSLSMKAGQSLVLKPNSLYNITGFKINDETISWTGGYDYTIGCVTGDTQIYIEAHPYGTVNATLNVSDPNQITVYRGYSYQNDVMTLTGTSNAIQMPENNAMISWEVANGCYIESVKVDGSDYSGNYLTITEGMVIDIVTKAIVMDKTAQVWIDDRSKIVNYFSLQTNTHEDLGESIKSGYNELKFYSGYVPFLLTWYTENTVVGKVYINDELQSPMYEGSNNYQLNLENLDIVKIFYAAEPVNCTVNFTVEDDLDPQVMRDVIRDVTDLTQPLNCFAGTQIDINKATQAFDVKVNDQALTPLVDTGNYRFNVTEPQTDVVISKKSTIGIGNIDAEGNVSAPVYNLQGVKVSDTLEGLPAGIYITAGKKVMVK